MANFRFYTDPSLDSQDMSKEDNNSPSIFRFVSFFDAISGYKTTDSINNYAEEKVSFPVYLMTASPLMEMPSSKRQNIENRHLMYQSMLFQKHKMSPTVR